MTYVRRTLLTACGLSLGFGLGCSSGPQATNKGDRSTATRPVQINRTNTKKFLPAEPESPRAPPVRK